MSDAVTEDGTSEVSDAVSIDQGAEDMAGAVGGSEVNSEKGSEDSGASENAKSDNCSKGAVAKTHSRNHRGHGGSKGAKGGARASGDSSGGSMNGSFKWETLKAMNYKRVFATPVIHNSDLFVIGGCDAGGQPIDTCEYYINAKRKWMKMPDMPTKRAAPGCGVVGDKLIVIGGVGEGQAPQKAIEVYSITDKKWKVMEPLGEPLQGISVVVKDNLLYFIGGMSDDTNPRGAIYSYDVENDVQKKYAAEMAVPRYATFSFLISDKIYTLGGRIGKLPSMAVECFDLATEKWEQLPDIPFDDAKKRRKRVFAMYTSVGKHIVSMGGLNQPATEGFSSNVEVFDTETKKWKIGANMNHARGDFAVGVIENQVICAGGLGNEGKPLKLVEVYNIENDQWTEITECPSAHCSCAHIMLNDRLYVLGGLGIGGAAMKAEALSFKKSN